MKGSHIERAEETGVNNHIKKQQPSGHEFCYLFVFMADSKEPGFLTSEIPIFSVRGKSAPK